MSSIQRIALKISCKNYSGSLIFKLNSQTCGKFSILGLDNDRSYNYFSFAIFLTCNFDFLLMHFFKGSPVYNLTPCDFTH